MWVDRHLAPCQVKSSAKQKPQRQPIRGPGRKTWAVLQASTALGELDYKMH